jgi:hypothetical protein
MSFLPRIKVRDKLQQAAGPEGIQVILLFWIPVSTGMTEK